MATHSCILAQRIPWRVCGVTKSQTWLSNFHFHSDCLEKWGYGASHQPEFYSGETGESQRVAGEISLPRAEATGVTDWQKHLSDNFDEVLGAECVLAWDRNFRGCSFGGGPHIHEFYLWEPSQVLTVKKQEWSPTGSSRSEKEKTLWNMPECSLYHRSTSNDKRRNQSLILSRVGTSFEL